MSLQKITSKRVELPVVYLVENEEDFKQLPKGLPYIIGKQSELSFITTFLEFQVLLKSCQKTLLPIKWLECLQRIGFKTSAIKNYTISSGGNYYASSQGQYALDINDFVEDRYFVDFDKLTELKLLPVWLDDLKTAIETNIIDEVTFDPTAFNKQLGVNIGAPGVKHNMKNLLILDISSSMPRSVVLTITNLAKLMSKKFYADVILTGRQSIMIDYDDVPNADIPLLTKNHGGGNEGEMYIKLLKEPKNYGTVISFGDNDSPDYYFNKEDKCNFTVDTLYSLHTEGNKTNNVTGYAKCFKPKTTHIVRDWVTTIQ